MSPSSFQHPSFFSVYFTLPQSVVGGPTGGGVTVLADGDGVCFFVGVVVSEGDVVGHVAPTEKLAGT